MTTEAALTLGFPDPALVHHSYPFGSGRERPRHYMNPTEGWEYPGITTVLKAWDKEGLVKWAADLEREACLQAAAGVYEQVMKGISRPAPPQFRGNIEKHLGPERSHVKAKEKAADIGKAAHEYIEWKIKAILGVPRGPEPVIPEASELAVMAFDDHFKVANCVPLKVEQPMWSHEHRVCGTVDHFMLRDGKIGIVDLKSSKATYSSAHLQVAGYIIAAEERLGIPIEWAELWRVPKTLEDIRFEVTPFAHVGVWDGNKSVKVKRSWDELKQAFLGIRTAWEYTCRPL